MTARLLTAREVAEQLGVSAETVLRWTRAGKLPAIELPSPARSGSAKTSSTPGWSSGRRSGEECHQPRRAPPQPLP